MQVMRGLHSLLQEAVHAKAWDAQYTVSGPLTWRMFHRLAGRGNLYIFHFENEFIVGRINWIKM